MEEIKTNKYSAAQLRSWLQNLNLPTAAQWSISRDSGQNSITFDRNLFCSIGGTDMNAYVEFDGWINIELQHTINANELDSFVYRANVSIPSLNTGLSKISQAILTTNNLENLKKLSESGDFYRLKAVVEYPNGVKRTFLTANTACNLLSSQLHDELWISIDASGYVNAVSLSTSAEEYIDCSTMDFSHLPVTELNTEVLIKHTELAPIPDTASFIQKIEREREARERGESKDNRGFFAKYWMYIIPVVLLVFISGATNPEQQK